MKIVFVHQYFADPTHAAGTRPFDFVRALIKRGHEVVVVTGDVNHHTRQRIAASPSVPGARVVVVRLFSGYGRSLWLRVINNLDFMMKSIRAARREDAVALYYGSAMPIFAPIAAAFAARGRAPWVFEVRDLFPESLESVPGIASWLARRLFRPIVARLYRSALCIVVVSPAFVPFVRRYGVQTDRILIVPHGADISMFSSDSEPDPDLHVVYTGALGRAQGVEAFAAVARLLPPDVRVVVYGDGPEAETARDASARVSNLVWGGVLPKTEIPGALNAAAICLLILRDIPIFRTVYPNKLFEYMASARPVIVTFEGAAATLVTSSGAGVVALTPSEVASHILRLRNDPDLRRSMGEAGRNVVANNFDRARLFEALVDDLESRLIVP